jgi:hypothetical protein
VLLILTMPLLMISMACFSLSSELSSVGFCYCNDLLFWVAEELLTSVEFNLGRIISLPLNSG